MKPMLRRIFVLLAAISLLLGGCAGSGKNIQSTATPEWVKLPETVPESFSCQIADKQARKMIQGIHTDALGPAKRLEIKLLKELAVIEHPDALGNAFDRVWDTEETLKRVAEQEEPPSAFTPALALSYFMLTYDDTYNWRDKTAEKIYNRGLQNTKPNQLNGYPLHFFTLALLRQGDFEHSWPFLKQLKKMTTPSIYTKDLTIALNYAAARENPQFAGKIIQHLIIHCRQNDLNLPDEKIAAALTKLEKSSNIEPVARILLTEPSESQKLESYAFFSHISSYKKKEQPVPQKQPLEKPIVKKSEIKKTAAASKKSEPETAKKNTDKPEISKINIREDAVRIRVQTISADNKAEYLDPELGEIGPQLNESLQVSQLYLKEETKFLLIPGQKEKVAIDSDHNVIVLLKSVSADNARINVTVLEGGEKIYNTVIESVNKGETIIGGPVVEETQLILRITTWLEI